MSDQELSAIFGRHAFDPWVPAARGRDCSVVMDREAFYEAVREAIAAKTRELVDAMRPMAKWIRILPPPLSSEPTIVRGDMLDKHIREAARLVAEYDAKGG